MRPEQTEFTIKTLTPVWTGGAQGYCDRMHETGIIGSLRFWYETIVRGLGGDVCDPVSENRCELSGREKDEERIKKLCPACYLFGCGGWKRQFQFGVEKAPTVPLHFRSTLPRVNKNWLTSLFMGKDQDATIDNCIVFYGDIAYKIVFRGEDYRYVLSQLKMLMKFISEHAGIGAKLQHGFGQVYFDSTKSQMDNCSAEDGLEQLRKRIPEFHKLNVEDSMPYNLQNYLSIFYEMPRSKFEAFLKKSSHLGRDLLIKEDGYIPCALDLRYKGGGNFGMRRWLKEYKKWTESSDPKKLGKIDELLGPRSQWMDGNKMIKIEDEIRTASRLNFGMPYRISNGNYRLHIFGFAPPALLSPEALKDLCGEYMHHAFGQECSPCSIVYGREIIRAGEVKGK
ncbi:MAG: type III-B CRISPR module RAMP protein Cmr1 [Dethiobacter sp.]|jgi:CRISPR-associated protein Cmr1|nr:MAG: type III-B CRISPR module RAMP protein Cmr1 [Dethiobacter sp.]